MPNDTPSQADQAQELCYRGLLLCRKGASPEEHGQAAELWQQAAALYRKAGMPEKAAEMDRLYGKLLASALGFNRNAVAVSPRRKEKWAFREWHVFLKVGLFGFGGPMAVWGLLQDELVERRAILTQADFIEAAVIGDILPGPVTMDIVTYAGYKLRGWMGAWLATLLFILPAFIIMVMLEAHYDRYMAIPAVKGEFQILGAAVTAIILSVGFKLSREQLQGYGDVCIFLWAFVSSLVFKFDILYVVVLAGLAGLALEAVKPVPAVEGA